MKAQISEDMILSLGHGQEIGRMPQGVGIERLRFDGQNIVDLMDLTTIHVRPLGNSFELHAIPVLDSQPVQMTYPDRKKLVNDNGTIRLLTEQEMTDKWKGESLDQLKSRLRRNIAKQVGDRDDQIADTAKILSMLISAVVNGDPVSLAALAELQPLMAELYSPADTIETLKYRATALKNTVVPYYQQKGQINS